MCAAAKGNKYALGHSHGRPPLYDTPEQLEKQVKRYFKWCEGDFHIETFTKVDVETGEERQISHQVCDREPERYSTTGLALYLGFSSRQSLYDLSKTTQDFSYIIKRALLVIENMYENKLNGVNVAGPIFALSNMGWKNRQAMELSDPNGKPLFSNLDLKNWSEEDLKKATELAQKIKLDPASNS